MTFVPLVDAWEASRRERTGLRPGERCASIESEIGAPMTPGRVLGWVLGLDRDDPDRDGLEPDPEADDEEWER